MKLQFASQMLFVSLGYYGYASAFQPSLLSWHGKSDGHLCTNYQAAATKKSNHQRIQMLSPSGRTSSTTATQLNDMSEWRDLMLDPPNALTGLELEDYQQGSLKEVCILPFPLSDTLIQGETKELCLYEERFHKLFTKSMEEHGGVVAMGLLAPPAGILQTMSLCEIESFRTMEGDTGFETSYSILATIRAVGRASLVDIRENGEGEGVDINEFLTGWCTELVDLNDESDDSLMPSANDAGSDSNQNTLKGANDMLDRCEDVFNSIQKMEKELQTIAERNDTSGIDDVQSEFVESEATLKRKMLEAELELEYGEDDDDDETDDDEIDDSDVDDEDCAKFRLQKAFKTALSTDTQGYRVSSLSASIDNNIRSIQDLTAWSWAYFSVNENPEDALSFRLKCLEITSVKDRLKLALVMMMEHRSKLRAALRATSDSSENIDPKRNW
eukprot:CAMPEP_0194083994 /NCGR_PEP_ID=MMETSP0149-20130528/10944_1 /TAXON_ID=122233 /ORGANISM="Chaetoceros debilis, Strain MM31A-1" /LENGTH=442 /DNA_ID=CAMNT_0038766515 /DNA_START=162 /DNA_END=1487 /DNA_ORIENTATION=+